MKKRFAITWEWGNSTPVLWSENPYIAHDWNVVSKLSGHSARVNSVSYKKGLILTTSEDRTARAWCPSTGRELLRFTGSLYGPVTGHLDGVRGILQIAEPTPPFEWGIPGHFLTWSADGTMKLWAISRVRGFPEALVSKTIKTPGWVTYATQLHRGWLASISISQNHRICLFDKYGNFLCALEGHTKVPIGVVQMDDEIVSWSEDHEEILSWRVWKRANKYVFSFSQAENFVAAKLPQTQSYRWVFQRAVEYYGCLDFNVVDYFYDETDPSHPSPWVRWVRACEGSHEECEQ